MIHPYCKGGARDDDHPSPLVSVAPVSLPGVPKDDSSNGKLLKAGLVGATPSVPFGDQLPKLAMQRQQWFSCNQLKQDYFASIGRKKPMIFLEHVSPISRLPCKTCKSLCPVR